MSARGFLGLEWGVHHYSLYDSPLAMDIGRFGFAGCLDAPDEIPAGGWRSEWFGEINEWVPIEAMVPREPVQRNGKSNV